MRLREFKEPRQRIDEVAVVALAPYIYMLLAAGGAIVAGDPRTQKVIQRKIDQWVDSNPSQANEFGKQIKQGQDAGALPKDPSKVGDVAFPIASALSSAWDWMTGGSTTGTKPAQPGDYVKDKNGMLRRKETSQEIQKKIGDVIASNTTRFDNQANAQKALPSLKDGTVVTIGGKTYKVSPDAGGRLSAEKRGFVPYKDMGKVTGKPVTGQVDDIKDFSASPSTSAADDDYYTGTTSRPSAGSTNKSGPSWLDRAADTVGGMFNTVAGAVGGLFGSEDDVKPSTVPPQSSDLPKPGGRTDWSKDGIPGAPPKSGATTKPDDKTTSKPIAPPVVRPGDEAGQGVPGATSGTTSGTGAQAGTGAETGTGAQAGTGAETGTVANTQATTQTQAQTDTVATTVAQPQTAVAPPVTPPPVVVPPAKPKNKTEPYQDQDVIYTGWRKGPPKKVIRLR
jgi:hypothetical protein